jgi:hypothetical protein
VTTNYKPSGIMYHLIADLLEVLPDATYYKRQVSLSLPVINSSDAVSAVVAIALYGRHYHASRLHKEILSDMGCCYYTLHLRRPVFLSP